MSSVERKLRRGQLKRLHKELGKFLQHQRSVGQKTLTVQDDNGNAKQIMLPSLPPLGHYIKKAQESAALSRKREVEKRLEEEKKVDLEWEDQ